MDRYGKRLLAAAGFLVIVTLSVSLLPKPAATADSRFAETVWSDAALPAEDGAALHLPLALWLPQMRPRVVTFTLVAVDGTEFVRAFVAGRAGAYALEFSGIPPGLYTLRRDGRAVYRILLTSQTVKTAKISS